MDLIKVFRPNYGTRKDLQIMIHAWFWSHILVELILLDSYVGLYLVSGHFFKYLEGRTLSLISGLEFVLYCHAVRRTRTRTCNNLLPIVSIKFTWVFSGSLDVLIIILCWLACLGTQKSTLWMLVLYILFSGLASLLCW